MPDSPDTNRLHPEMQALIDAKADLPPGNTIEEMRDNWNVYAARMRRPHPADMTVTDGGVAGKGGTIPIRIYRPAAASDRASSVLYFHGGGFMKGDLDSSDTVAWGLAQETGAVVVSVDYRLAPEHTYPAAFDDCFSVLADVGDGAGRYGVDPARIAVCGDSAGGNLAAAVSLAARDRGGPAIAAQVLIYPCLTDDLKHASYRTHAETPGLTTASMGSYWQWYLGAAGTPSKDPYAVPLKAEKLSGLPRDPRACRRDRSAVRRWPALCGAAQSRGRSDGIPLRQGHAPWLHARAPARALIRRPSSARYAPSCGAASAEVR